MSRSWIIFNEYICVKYICNVNLSRIMSDRYAILGILNKGDHYGYEILKTFNYISPFWYVQPGNVYRALHSLQEEGFVSIKRVDHPQGMDRKIYGITEKGRRVFEEWLTKSIRPTRMRLESLLKVWLASDDPLLLRRLLEEHRKQVLRSMRNLKSIVAGTQGSDFDLVISAAIHHNQAALEWIEESIHRIEKVESIREAK